MAKLIVPIGEMGVGKSTATQLLRMAALERGLDVRVMAFAEPLKTFCKKVFDFSDHALWGPSEERNKIVDVDWDKASARYNFHCDEFVDDVMDHPWQRGEIDAKQAAVAQLNEWFQTLSGKPLSPRLALQTLGTEWGRDKVDKDIWINHLNRKAARLSRDTIVIVEDGRFLNEAVGSGGFPVLIRRYRQLPLFAAQPQHESEAQQGSKEMLDYCQRNGVVVDNVASQSYLKQKMDDVIKHVMIWR